MKYFWFVTLGVVIGLIGSSYYFEREHLIVRKLPEAQEQVLQPLLKYTINNLRLRSFNSEIRIGEEISKGVFLFDFDSDGKRVSGLAHIPENCGKCSVLVQFRGYAEKEGYKPGFGTWRSAEKYAEAGFISLAPDFLGYGESASPSADVFEERFEKYTTALNLIAGVKKWEKFNGNLYLWGHSNGGQVAVTVLEVLEEDVPTSLWAPVSAGFPYSILYYMNDNNESDKLLRQKLADFETIYDSKEFNMLNFLDQIGSEVIMHQGTADESIPINWARELKQKIKNINYFEYPSADHNLVPFWDQVIKRDIDFFKSH